MFQEDSCSSWSPPPTNPSDVATLWRLESCEETSWCEESTSDKESWVSCEWSFSSSPLSCDPYDSPAPLSCDLGYDYETPPRPNSVTTPPVPVSVCLSEKQAKYDPSCAVRDEIGWQLSRVMQLNGCQPQCAKTLHGLHEYDALLAHSMFTSKSVAEQRCWLMEYFVTHCPVRDGTKDFKAIKFMLCGKAVCQNLWLATHAVSSSRFYDIRKDFLSGIGINKGKKSKTLASKSMKSIEWMSSYFDRVGDKRPDKFGIYLPSCLTERTIYNLMIQDISESSAISFSQFNKLYRTQFPAVSIPKASYSNLCSVLFKSCSHYTGVPLYEV